MQPTPLLQGAGSSTEIGAHRPAPLQLRAARTPALHTDLLCGGIPALPREACATLCAPPTHSPPPPLTHAPSKYPESRSGPGAVPGEAGAVTDLDGGLLGTRVPTGAEQAAYRPTSKPAEPEGHRSFSSEGGRDQSGQRIGPMGAWKESPVVRANTAMGRRCSEGASRPTAPRGVVSSHPRAQGHPGLSLVQPPWGGFREQMHPHSPRGL